ncbi:hypothetical protein FACS189414_5070 [Bacteroidia bacterium]|nr:hypothetical protein AGMMS49574_09480 [Bacteroidia bacterium]GHU55439.1 hypothetical protein FACS189411_03870 [Bacteroidia bacterium]GHU77739.1 hypothetical protein FACS189414_5070 [Bacteroidia bacterium]
MTGNNLIIIKGGSYNEIKKALIKWLDVNQEDIPHDFQFELCENNKGERIIYVDDSLTDDSFLDFVNTLKYLFDIKAFTQDGHLPDTGACTPPEIIHFIEGDTRYKPYNTKTILLLTALLIILYFLYNRFIR